MSDVATVNGIETKFHASAVDSQGEVDAREVATALPTGDDRVDRVASDVTSLAIVWLADDLGEDDGGRFRPPEGYTIDNVFVSSNGGVGVEVISASDAEEVEA